MRYSTMTTTSLMMTLAVCAFLIVTSKNVLVNGFSGTTTMFQTTPASALRIAKNHGGWHTGGTSTGWATPSRKSLLFAETNDDLEESFSVEPVVIDAVETVGVVEESDYEEPAKDEDTIEDINSSDAVIVASEKDAEDHKEEDGSPDTESVIEIEEVVEEEESKSFAVDEEDTYAAVEDGEDEDGGDSEAVAAASEEGKEKDEDESTEEEAVVDANVETDVVEDDVEKEEETINETETVDQSQSDVVANDEADDVDDVEGNHEVSDGNADPEEEDTIEDPEDANEIEVVATSVDSDDDNEDDATDDSEITGDATIFVPTIYNDTEDALAPTPSSVSESAEKSIFFAAEKEDVDVAKKVQGLDLDLIANVAGDIARDFLSVLRFRTANLLTSSLPKDQRDELLTRMGASTISLPPANTDDDAALAEEVVSQTNQEEQRASINEEIALARAEEAQKIEKKWEREKAEILSEMEEAANARVENELKIQRMRLEEETAKALAEKEEAMKVEKQRLEQAIQEEREKADALAAASAEEKETDVDDLFAVRTDEEEARNKELEALLEKRQEQQAALESIEEELRSSVLDEEEQRERLQDMLTKRQAQQEELDAVEADLRKQVSEIESEKARYQQLVADLEAMKSKEKELREESAPDEEPFSESDEEDEITAAQEHPVLGPVIADLGYKRIHFVSAGRLGTIPVWSRNRTYRNNRAKSMATEKLKTMELGFPGVIGLHEAPSGKLSIVDGQHRVGMMAALREMINKKIEKGDNVPEALADADATFERVLVEVYPEPAEIEDDETSKAGGDGFAKTVSDGFAEKIFVEINKAEPVKLIDMPGVASAADRKIITEAVETLQDQYEHMFSPSQRCRVPNVNVDNLRSMIFGANVLKKHKLNSGKKLTDWLIEQNAALGDEYENNKSKQELFSKKQWSKASSNNFYLGLESSWLYK